MYKKGKLKKIRNINVLKGKEEWNMLKKKTIKSDDPFLYNLSKYEASRILWTV